MDMEVAKLIKRIRIFLTDASELSLALSFKISLPPLTHKQLSVTNRVFLSIKHVCARVEQVGNFKGASASYLLETQNRHFLLHESVQHCIINIYLLATW